MVGGASCPLATVMAMDPVAVTPLASVAVTVWSVVGAETRGVPETMPLTGLRTRPVGSVGLTL